MLRTMTILELDDHYYERHRNGAKLQELQGIRKEQEVKLRALPPEERRHLSKQIRDRCYSTLLSASARAMLSSLRK